VPDQDWDADPDLLAFENGVLRISTLEFGPHSQDYHLTSKLPFPYDPTATSEVWQQFLNDTVSEASDFLQEFAGYCLTTSCRYELAVWLHGPPGGGKSTFVEGLTAMLGRRAFVLGMANIESSRFGLTGTSGKTLAVSNEQPSRFLKCVHVLNDIISGSAIKVEQKYRDPVEIIPHCKLLWAMNDLPRVDSPQSGLFRRVKVVHFPSIPIELRNPRVKEEIQRSGMAITNWALAGLARLNERGRFIIPACVEEATESYQTSNDVPLMFVEECCEVDPAFRVQSSEIYQLYSKWCKMNGHSPVSSTRFSDDLARLGFTKFKQSAMYWRGIRVKDTANSILDDYCNGTEQ